MIKQVQKNARKNKHIKFNLIKPVDNIYIKIFLIKFNEKTRSIVNNYYFKASLYGIQQFVCLSVQMYAINAMSLV